MISLSSRSHRRALSPLLLVSLILSSGCRPNANSPKIAEAPKYVKPPEIPSILGGTTKLRLQIDVSPNPPYVGLVAYDLWVTDPGKMLAPVSGAKVTLKASPPSHIKGYDISGTVTTDAEGKATLRMAYGFPGVWSLYAFVKSPKNGTLNYSHPVRISLMPGQTASPPKKRSVTGGPLRSSAPAVKK